jgi:hypothetical protein
VSRKLSNAHKAFLGFLIEEGTTRRCTRVVRWHERDRRESVRVTNASASALSMIFKLAEAAQKNWRRLDAPDQLPKVVLGVKFTDGLEVNRKLKPLPPDPSVTKIRR